MMWPFKNDLQIENECLHDALDHIMRVARASRSKSRCDRWIAERARCALAGTTEWKTVDLPVNADNANTRLRRKLAEVKSQLKEEG